MYETERNASESEEIKNDQDDIEENELLNDRP
jgi:hypothetical protein